MSWVTNVLVHVDVLDHEAQARMTEPQPWDELRHQSLGDLSGEHGEAVPFPYWGGNKVPEWDLFGAAFNYLDWEGFAEWLASLPFRRPDCVLVVSKGEDDYRPRMWRLVDGQLSELGD